MPRTQTLVIGAGQAGLALSRMLTGAGHDHVVLERGQIGERWRSERWDSLRLLTPNWLSELPGSPPHADPDGYLDRREFIAYLERYASSFGAPVHDGTTVLGVERAPRGYRVMTSRGDWLARNVVIASGDCDVPRVPAIAASLPAGVTQLPATRYRSPEALPAGGVLVVGAGPAGQQIALELRRAGRDVILAVGRHSRAVRRYRGRDIFRWLSELGDLERSIDEVADPDAARRAPSLPLSGAHGGEQLDLAVLHDAGVTVAGRLRAFVGTRAAFAADLTVNVETAERGMRRLLAKIDAHVATLPDAAEVPLPEAIRAVDLPRAPSSIDLRAAGVRTVVWATGYRRSYPWLRLPVVGADGELIHRHGMTGAPGVAALGLRFQRRRASHFIGGVGADAQVLAARLLSTERTWAGAHGMLARAA